MENDSAGGIQTHLVKFDQITVKQEVIDGGYSIAVPGSKLCCDRRQDQCEISDSYLTRDENNAQCLDNICLSFARPKIETEIPVKNEEFEQGRKEPENKIKGHGSETEIKKEHEYDNTIAFDNTNLITIEKGSVKLEKAADVKIENADETYEETEVANQQSNAGGVKVETVEATETNKSVKDDKVACSLTGSKTEGVIEGDDDGNVPGMVTMEECTGREDQAQMEKKGYLCKVCKKTFIKKSSLSSHEITHTGETPFKCQFCNKGFNVRSNLNVHLRIHTGQRPHVCEICQKTFTQAGQLKTHERIHKGEKPYRCNMCTRAFRSSSALITHQRTHTGERPFPCDICSRSFSTSTSLKTHRITHSGTMLYDCPVCGRQFNRKNNLNVHIKRHNKNRRFSCPKCSNGFVMRAHLTAHLKRTHKFELSADQLNSPEFLDSTEELHSEVEIGEDSNIGGELKYSQDIDMKIEDQCDSSSVDCDNNGYPVKGIKSEVHEIGYMT